jgi:hypothetical protein
MVLPLVAAGASAATSGAVGGAGAAFGGTLLSGVFSAFLLSMQAGGLITNFAQQKNQKKLIAAGRQLEQASFETNMEAIKLESNEASLNELKQLRQNIGTQIAANAAKGTDSGAGSALFATEKSKSNFLSDERVRRFNLLAKEANLRANKVLSGLHSLESETQLGRNLTSTLLNQMPISSTVDMVRKSKFSRKWFGEGVA